MSLGRLPCKHGDDSAWYKTELAIFYACFFGRGLSHKQSFAIWLAGEKGLHFDKFLEQESRNYFPSAGS